LDISKVRKKLKALNAEEEKKQASAVKEDASHPVDVKEPEAVQEPVPEAIEDPVTGPSGEDPLPIEEEIIPVAEIELIAFSVSNEEFAMKLSEMKEIIRAPILTPVPRSPLYLEGATFLRGRILPIINLKERLSLKETDEGRKKIIVMFTSKEPVGLIASRIIDVIRIPETDLLPPPSTLSAREKSFIGGVVKIGERFISVLTIDKIAEMEINQGKEINDQ
jgi:purine-binding chemotaxis protein CheW